MCCAVSLAPLYSLYLALVDPLLTLCSWSVLVLPGEERDEGAQWETNGKSVTCFNKTRVQKNGEEAEGRRAQSHIDLQAVWSDMNDSGTFCLCLTISFKLKSILQFRD